MDILGGFDVHRKQITFDFMEMDSGEVHRGKIRPADRESLREWLESFTEQFPEHERLQLRWRRPPAGVTSSRNLGGLE